MLGANRAVDWITDQIAIGNFQDARNLPPGIHAVLCLIEDCCADRVDVDAVCVPLVDGPGNDFAAAREAVDFISEVVDEGRRILVHCHAGRSRSVVIVARYLMSSRSLTAKQALELLASKREGYLSSGIEELLLGQRTRIR